MNKRLKLFASLASLCLSLAVLCFGVYAAIQVNYKLNGQISYQVQDVFVEIETRVYSSANKVADKNELTNLVNTLNNGVGEFTQENLQTAPTGFVSQPLTTNGSNYNHTYATSTNPVNSTESGEAELNLAFDTTNKMAFYIVMQVTNITGADVYITANEETLAFPENTISYNTSELKLDSKQTQNGVVTKNFIFAIALDDVTASISGTNNLTCPIVATLNKPEGGSMLVLHNVSPLKSEVQYVDLSSEYTAVDTSINQTIIQGSSIYYTMHNFSYDGTEAFDLSFYPSANIIYQEQNMENFNALQMAQDNLYSNVLIVKGKFETPEEVLVVNDLESIIVSAPTFDSTNLCYTATSVPVPNDFDGYYTILAAYYEDAVLGLSQYSASNLKANFKTTATNLKVFQLSKTVLEQTDVNSNVHQAQKVNFGATVQSYTVESNTFNMILLKLSLTDIPDDVEEIDINIGSSYTFASTAVLGHDIEKDKAFEIFNLAVWGNTRSQLEEKVGIKLLYLDLNGYNAVKINAKKLEESSIDFTLALSPFLSANAFPEGSIVDIEITPSFGELTYYLSYKLNDDGESYTLDDANEFAIPEAEITIPSEYNGLPVTTIGKFAFTDCDMTSVIMPDSITKIEGSGVGVDEAAFAQCKNLQNVKFSSKLSYIGSYAFTGCNNLTNIVLPESVTVIEYNAFNEIGRPFTITILSKSIPETNGAFMYEYATYTGCTIYVLENLLETYKTADNWSCFADLFEIYDPNKS